MAGSGMQDIKRRIQSITSIEHITNAMRLVSAAKLVRAKAEYEATTAYFSDVVNSIDSIFSQKGEIPARYLSEGRELKKTCYIVVTSNRGLAGSFNANVSKEVDALRAKADDEPLFVFVGTRGRDYYKRRGFEALATYSGAPEDVTFSDALALGRPVIKLYEAGEIDRVILVYNMFKSSLEQKVSSIQLLPFGDDSEEEKSDSVSSAASGASQDAQDSQDSQDEKADEKSMEVEYEPSAEAVFEYLIPKYLEIVIYKAIVESAYCEHTARRTAMQNATDNAKEMMDDLNLYYNRARQAAITSEITEIVSGADALNG
jgi:F-type H+-transporting ATPase subunit gamma